MPPGCDPYSCRVTSPYISWDQFLANQQRLQKNRSLPDTKVGEGGEALYRLVCGVRQMPGRRLSTRYKEDKLPGYYCEEI